MDCETLCIGLNMEMFVSDECCSESFCSCNEEFGKPQYSCPEGQLFCNAEQSCVSHSCSTRQCCSSDVLPTTTTTTTTSTTTTTTDVSNNFEALLGIGAIGFGVPWLATARHSLPPPVTISGTSLLAPPARLTMHKIHVPTVSYLAKFHTQSSSP